MSSGWRHTVVLVPGILGLAISTVFRASPWRAVVLVLSAIITAAANPLIVYGFSMVIGAAAGHRSLRSGLILTGVAMTALRVVNAMTSDVIETLDDHVARLVRYRLIVLVTSVPTIALHENTTLADRVSLLERQAHRLAGGWRLVTLLGGAASVATVGSMLAVVSPLMLVLIPLTLLPTVIRGRGDIRRQQLWLANERHRRLADSLMSALSSPKQAVEVRCFGLLRPYVALAAAALRTRSLPWLKARRRFAVLQVLAWTAFGMGYMASVLWIVLEVPRGRFNVQQAALVLLIGPTLAAAGETLGGSISRVADAVGTFSSFQWLKEFARDQGEPESKDAPARLCSGITLQGVEFNYSEAKTRLGDNSSLQGIEIHLPAGSIVAIVGDNGAGKSTVVKLLTRLYTPTSGRILVDGVELSDIDLRAWRARLAAGFQDFATLQFVLRESVGVGDLTKLDDETWIRAAIHAGDGDGAMAELPNGIDQQLGADFDDGAGLSGGQWQRVALARAFMRREPLLMLLDEPTSALDPRSEQTILDSYVSTARDVALRTGGITILVSHRLSVVRNADLIVVMSQGTIIESGTHDDLMRSGGHYAGMFGTQSRAYN